MILSEEYQSMKRTMRRLGFLDNQDIVTYKGKVACEISAADELVLGELVFGGYFEDLEKEQVCALLSMFVCDEGGKEEQGKVIDEKLSAKV